jgi:flavin-dependent dehydrogenase
MLSVTTSVSTHETYDAAILGGGLAGLTLARQLHLEAPHIRVLVVEKRKHPVREAAFKVGESSVEIGAHYLQAVLKLEPHLRAGQLEKLGLRYFFPDGDNRDLARRVELGPPTFPPVPSFQLDRGRLENLLLAELREAGVEVLDDCSVKQIDLQPLNHTIGIETRDGQAREVRARWVVDASGRAGLIKRQLGLTRPADHGANACWFRVPERVMVDDWSDDPAWRARVPSGQRWLSTNHLMGRGYWVWLIPLGSGSTSIGIVADGDLHPFSRLNRFERALDWLREFEPQCAEVVAGYQDRLEDFLALRHYAHSCERCFSPDGWSLVGEAGVFTDPFYSPGSDFIAIGNDCAADLIVRTARGEDIRERAEAFNTNYLRLFEAFLRLYSGQYPLMGNAQVMTAKAAWDNGAYWAITGLLYFQRRYTRPEFMQSIDLLMKRFFVLHARMQQLFHAWDLVDQSPCERASANVVDVPFLRRLQASLAAPPMDDDTLRRTLEANFTLLESFAATWQALASERNPSLQRFVAMTDGPLLDVSALVLQPLVTTGTRAFKENQEMGRN